MRRAQCNYIGSSKVVTGRVGLIAVVLFAGLAPGCDGDTQTPAHVEALAPQAAEAEESARWQVSLFWGGGEPRDWRGEFGLATTPGAAARIRWTWLTDFEEDDRCLVDGNVPVPQMAVPSGWRPTLPTEMKERPSASTPTPRGSGAGATIETSTDGEADGLCFEVIGSPRAKLVLDFGADAILETTLGDLVHEAVTVRVDDSGNVLFAQAIDLRRKAPDFALLGDKRARRTSLHTHSCFSTNQMQLEPVLNSLRPFVNSVWWTDHSVGDERRIFAGDFEDAELVQDFWKHYAGNSTVVQAGLTSDGVDGSNGFRLEVDELSEQPDQPGIAFIYQGGAAGEFNLGLCAEPLLRWSVQSLTSATGAPSSSFARVTLHSGKVIRYVLGAPNIPNAATDISVGDPADGWVTVERNIEEDARALYGDIGTDGFRRVNFGVFRPQAERAGVVFDDIELVVPEPKDVVRLQAEKLGQFYDPSCFAALEQSAWTGPREIGALFPHLTALVPGEEPKLLTGFDHEPTSAERREFNEKIQAAGGVVGTHHMQLDEHYEAFLDGGGLGADMFEVGGAWWFVPAYSTQAERADRDAHGYPQLDEDEVYPLLVRWDRMTARGLLLTGYGAPDLHQLFEAPSYGFMNRWLTWVFPEDDSPEAELHALRTGQACASEWRSDVIMRLDVEQIDVDGKSVDVDRDWMGKLVVTNREWETVIANLVGVIPGSTVRWIQGDLVRADVESVGFDPGTIGKVKEERVTNASFASRLEVDTSHGVFVRAEVLNPAGHIVAFSNPITFASYRPVDLADRRIIDLERERADSGGKFDVAVDTKKLRAIPKRKELMRSIDVGRVESEGDWNGLGFGEPVIGPMLLNELDGSYREVIRGRFRFEMDIPKGESSWIRFRTHGYVPVTGRLEMNDVEVGRFARMEALSFELPAAEVGASGDHRVRFDLIFDELQTPLPEGTAAMLLQRIELFAGDGVMHY